MSSDETPSTTTATPIRIPKLCNLNKQHIGSQVKLNGWVYSTRSQGAGSLLFIDLGDGTVVTPVRCIAQRPTEDGEEVEGNTNPPYGSTPTALTNATNDEAEYSRLTFDELTSASHLSIGCSVLLIGLVTDPPEGTTQSFEIAILELFLIGGVADPTKYPITKSILKKPLALRPHYHARFRAPIVQQLMLVRSQALFAVHEFFNKEGVPLLDPMIMTSNDCEGAGEVFKVTPQFFGPVVKEEGKKKKNKNKNKGKKPPAAQGGDSAGDTPPPPAAAAVVEDEKPPVVEEEKTLEVGLTVSSQLPLEAIAMGTGSVYTCQKSFRAEKSDTNKHLAEFLHVEYEQYFIGLDDLLDQAERFVKYVVKTVIERCEAQYDFLDGRATAPPEFHGHRAYLLTLLDKPFKRIKHAEAVDAMLQDLRDKVKTIGASGKEVKLKFKEKPQHGQDLASEHEKYLVQKYGTFTFVTHWPSDIKSFYMKQVGDGTCESFDLLAPLAGELFGGSMREWRKSVLEERMKLKGMDVGPLKWFVDLRGDGTAPHGGWGMGFDRLVMFLTGAASVRDVVPYPVYYGHCPY